MKKFPGVDDEETLCYGADEQDGDKKWRCACAKQVKVLRAQGKCQCEKKRSERSNEERTSGIQGRDSELS